MCDVSDKPAHQEKECPICSQLQVTGTFKTHPTERAPLKPFRVQRENLSGTVVLGDYDSIELARAAACGTNFEILSRAYNPGKHLLPPATLPAQEELIVAILRTLSRAYGGDGSAGVNYTDPNGKFTLRQYNEALDLPNFEYPGIGVEVTWYKYIGRGTKWNKKLSATAWGRILVDCLPRESYVVP